MSALGQRLVTVPRRGSYGRPIVFAGRKLQLRRANDELAAFLRAVTKLYGPEQARLSAEDWLDEANQTERPPWLAIRNWRDVTIAASARLANRLNDVQRRRRGRSGEPYQSVGD